MNKLGLDLPAFFVIVSASSLLCLVRGFCGLFRPGARRRDDKFEELGFFYSPNLVSSFVPPSSSSAMAPLLMPPPMRTLGGLSTPFLRNRGSGCVATTWVVSPFGCSVVWCVGQPAVLVASGPKFYYLGIQRSHDMSVLSMCYLVRLSKTSFLRREGLQLQVASLAQSSSNLL